jgi:Flp pilus assembly protein TadG
MLTRRKFSRHPAMGSVAVEMAAVLPIFILLLALPFFLARVFWYYDVGQKAAHDAARYMSMASQAEMRTPGSGFNEAQVPAVARWIAQQELEEILPYTDGIIINIQCDLNACGATAPATVRADVQITLHDSVLSQLTSTYLGSTSMILAGDVTMRYAGN